MVTLLVTSGQPACAAAEDHLNDGLAVSQKWIAQIDAGQYDESYLASSQEMRIKVPQDRWSLVLRTIRTPWGPVVSRHQLSHVYKPNGFEGAEGEFLVVTYDTAFQKLSAATELVVLRWEDGQWRGAGYNAGPKPSTDAPAPDANINGSTEIQTEHTAHPEQQ